MQVSHKAPPEMAQVPLICLVFAPILRVHCVTEDIADAYVWVQTRQIRIPNFVEQPRPAKEAVAASSLVCEHECECDCECEQ